MSREIPGAWIGTFVDCSVLGGAHSQVVPGALGAGIGVSVPVALAAAR